MFYKNARIFCEDFRFRTGAFEVVDGKFGAILPDQVPEDAVDLKGATVIPGLVEVHSHGAVGADFSDGDYEGLKTIAAYYASVGVTSFAPISAWKVISLTPSPSAIVGRFTHTRSAGPTSVVVQPTISYFQPAAIYVDLGASFV